MKQLITTPIYYVNDIPHIGHAYTTIIADMLKKHYHLQGDKVFFLTGTDEHGQKIEQSAKAKGKSPQSYTDEISSVFRSLWDFMRIDYDHFIRTTDSYHMESIKRVFEQLCARGDVYLGEYEGDYCVSCESFFLNVDSGICPECAGEKRLTKIKEESYFFALSRYQDKLLEWYASSETLILPKYRKNEVMRFVEGGLQDLSISRTSFSWGVQLPAIATKSKNGESKTPSKQHIAYVWLDALFNYMSALGFYNDSANGAHISPAPISLDSRSLESKSQDSKAPYAQSPEELQGFWQHATHIVGKDILRFHAVYWPAFLMSLGLELPKHIYAHGWWMRDGQKMSKSLGNVIDPRAFAQSYGIESLRYYLLRETPFGQDGDFSQRGLIERINGELANDLGNLLNRVLGISEKYTALRIDAPNFSAQGFVAECEPIAETLSTLSASMRAMQTKAYIESIWKLLHIGNAAIAKYEPWNLFKANELESLQNLLCLLGNLLLKVAHALYPIMPETSRKIAMAFTRDIAPESYAHFITANAYDMHFTLHKVAPLFQKIDSLLVPEVTPESSPESKAPDKSRAPDSTSTKSTADTAKTTDTAGVASISEIGISDFARLDIRVGEVLACERVPKSTKLLRLQLDIGESEPRVVLSGIAEYYTPEQLIGTQVCMIANLKPAKIMGQYSYGMILASKDSESLSLVRIDGRRKNGSKIS